MPERIRSQRVIAKVGPAVAVGLSTLLAPTVANAATCVGENPVTVRNAIDVNGNGQWDRGIDIDRDPIRGATVKYNVVGGRQVDGGTTDQNGQIRPVRLAGDCVTTKDGREGVRYTVRVVAPDGRFVEKTLEIADGKGVPDTFHLFSQPATPTTEPTRVSATQAPKQTEVPLRPAAVLAKVQAETTPLLQPPAAPLTESERLQKQIDELRRAIDEQKKINANSELVRRLDKELTDLILAGKVAPGSTPTPAPTGSGQGPTEAFDKFRADHQNWTKALAALGILAVVGGGIASRSNRARRVVVNTALFMPRGVNWVYKIIRGQGLPNMWP